MSESSSGTSDTSESDSPLLESAYPSGDQKTKSSHQGTEVLHMLLYDVVRMGSVGFVLQGTLVEVG